MTNKTTVTSVVSFFDFSDFHKELIQCEGIIARCGMELTEEQIWHLHQHHCEALKQSGRIEFGENSVKRLISAFCSSQYITGDQLEETIADLTDIFYHWKNLTKEQISDEELTSAMVSFFNGKGEGSVIKMQDLTASDIVELCNGKEAER